MGLTILKILAIIDVMLFIIIMFFTKQDKNKLFIQFVLLTFPLMSINFYGELSCFDTLCILFLIFFYKRKINNHSDGIVYLLFFILFAFSVFVGLLSASFPIDSSNLYLVVSFFTVFFYSKMLIDECLHFPDYFYSVLKYLKTILLFSFVFLLFQFIIGTQLSLSNYQNPNIVSSEGIRYPSFLSDPQVYSQFLGSLSFLCMIHNAKNETLRNYDYLIIILCLIGILITGGRAGLFGLFIGFSFVLLFSKWRFRLNFVLFSILLYFITTLFLNDMMIFKRGTELNEAYLFRYTIWVDAIQIFLKYPFFGIGLGNYVKYVSLHNPDQSWLRNNEYITFDHPESGYLKILTETGFIGFVSFAFLFLIPMLRGIKQFFTRKDRVLVLLIASLICWMVGFYSTFSLGETRLKIMVVTILSLLIFRLNYLKSSPLIDSISKKLIHD